MTAWGGHRNGRIPLADLEYVGIGVRSGQPQYLHPTVAQAWRNLQAALRAQGVNLLITEGYRTLALQQVYWDRKQADPRAPAAARPGTSNHGWGTAVDMANYLAVPATTRRRLIREAGFSTATGDRVREPWHIEYVGVLAPAASPGTPVTPGNPTPPEIEDDMFTDQDRALLNSSRPIRELIRTPDGTVWYCYERLIRYAIPSERNLNTYRAHLANLGYSNNVQEKSAVDIQAYGAPVFADEIARTASAVDARLKARFEGLGTGDGDGFAEADRSVLAGIRDTLARVFR